MNDYASSHFHKATALMDEGKNIEAIEEFRILAEIDPNDGWPHIFIGSAIKQIDITTAILEYQQAVALSSHDPDVHWLSGEFYEEIGERTKAISEYNESLNLDPNADRYYLLGIYLEEIGEVDGAVDAYRRAVIIRPNYVNSLASLARALIVTGHKTEAHDLLQKFLSSNQRKRFKQIEDLVNLLHE